MIPKHTSALSPVCNFRSKHATAYVTFHLVQNLNLIIYLIKTESLTPLLPVPNNQFSVSFTSNYGTNACLGSYLSQISKEYPLFLSFPYLSLYKLSVSDTDFFSGSIPLIACALIQLSYEHHSPNNRSYHLSSLAVSNHLYSPYFIQPSIWFKQLK